MAVKRHPVTDSGDAPSPAPDPQAVVVAPKAAIAAPLPMPLIGVACDEGTSGWFMGIGKAPETKAEHTTRLGAAAGKPQDIGWVLGTLEPRTNWPAPPVVAAPAQQAAQSVQSSGTGTPAP